MWNEFEQRAAGVLGGWGWKKKLAKALGVNPGTIQRWRDPSGPGVPDYAWAAVELLEQLRELRIPYPRRWWGSVE
jgi:hypothetical protein